MKILAVFVKVVGVVMIWLSIIPMMGAVITFPNWFWENYRPIIPADRYEMYYSSVCVGAYLTLMFLFVAAILASLGMFVDPHAKSAGKNSSDDKAQG